MNELFYVQISCTSNSGLTYKVKPLDAKETDKSYTFNGTNTGIGRRISKDKLGVVDSISKNVLPGAIYYYAFCLEPDIEYTKAMLLEVFTEKVIEIQNELAPYLNALGINNSLK